MATPSKNTYECFICKKQGFDVKVYLGRKDEHGKTIYLESDGVTAHIHKFKEGASATANGNTTVFNLLNEINGKLDRLLAIEGQD